MPTSANPGRDPELDAADAEYVRLLQNDPSLVDVWRMRSRVALERLRSTDAIELLRQGIVHNPRGLPLIADLANIYLLQKDSIAARPLVEQLIRDDEGKPEYQHSLARLLWIEGAYDEALVHFENAVKKNPEQKRFAVALARAWLSLDEVSKAVALLKRWEHKDIPGEMLSLLALCRFDDEGPTAALDVVAEGLRRQPEHPLLNYLNAALLTLSGQHARVGRSASLIKGDELMGVRWQSFEFAFKQHIGATFCGLDSRLFAEALKTAPATGLVLEFGVYHGLSLRKIAAYVDGPLHGFDSFEGLPEDWKPGEPRGSYSTHGRQPQVPPRVSLYKGWFSDTLPTFVAAQTEKLRFVHIDCDLYSSTATVLDSLRPLLQVGAVLVFDEYLGFSGYEQHEFRAWQEFSTRHGFGFEYIAFGLMAKQAALRITAL